VNDEEEKPVLDHEVFNHIQKNILANQQNNKIKVFTDLIKDGADRWDNLTSYLGLIPRRIL